MVCVGVCMCVCVCVCVHACVYVCACMCVCSSANSELVDEVLLAPMSPLLAEAFFSIDLSLTCIFRTLPILDI